MAGDLRLGKKIKINKRTVTVSEICAGDLRKILAAGADLESMAPLQVVDLLAPMVCDLSPEEFDAAGISALMEIWDAFREVNPGFFELARRTGLTGKIQDLAELIQQKILIIWNEVCADLSDGDTSTPPDTD